MSITICFYTIIRMLKKYVTNKRFENVWVSSNNPAVNIIITTFVMNENRKQFWSEDGS
jgi:hypothetical protein